ncbi:hypothetical protein F5Y08DRAFT_317942 [Xylaria arbuscula]|nr:hypothetical protein F5Y08DRAFT_317942 [Xylaria arbuscula]
MRAQITSAVAALAACVAALPATPDAAAAAAAHLETRTPGLWNGRHLSSIWFPMQIWSPKPYTIYWAELEVDAYDNKIYTRPSFTVSCLAYFDDRTDPADSTWYPCVGYTQDTTVEAQYTVVNGTRTINVRQKWTRDGVADAALGVFSNVPANAVVEEFDIPYAGLS